MTKQFLLTVGILGSTGVIFGAFGSHLLNENISASNLGNWNLAVMYQMIHTLALLAITFMNRYVKRGYLNTIYYLFVIGIFLFCGSLYISSISELTGIEIGVLKYSAPLGGLLLIAGWLFIIQSGIAYQHQKRSSRH